VRRILLDAGLPTARRRPPGPSPLDGSVSRRVLPAPARRLARQPGRRARARQTVDRARAAGSPSRRVQTAVYGSAMPDTDIPGSGPAVHSRRDSVARLMAAAGFEGVHRRRAVRTTVRDRDAAPVPDLVNRARRIGPGPVVGRRHRVRPDLVGLPPRDGRELLPVARGRAARPDDHPDPGRHPASGVRLHRGLLTTRGASTRPLAT
jgi:hypothetical protein